jgi:hypothetical protein
MPHVAANELICALLAGRLGLPTLDFRLVERDADVYFGSAWLDKRHAFYPALTADLFARAANRDRVYDVVVFDYWVRNVDRHQHNLLLRRTTHDLSGPELLTLNDHSHAVIPHGVEPENLANFVRDAPPVPLDFIRDAIVSRTDLSAAIGLVEGIDDGTIASVVNAVPDALLSASAKPHVDAYLRTRRENVRDIFSASVAVFTKFQGTRL